VVAFLHDAANATGRNKLINFKNPGIARIRGFRMGGQPNNVA
jgi:hypothetical protein